MLQDAGHNCIVGSEQVTFLVGNNSRDTEHIAVQFAVPYRYTIPAQAVSPFLSQDCPLSVLHKTILRIDRQ
jgi:hypothetical protein